MVCALIGRSLSVMLVIIGSLLAFGGVQLVLLGGTPYYLISALVLFISAFFNWRGDRRGPVIFAVFLMATLLWALWESGWDGWALAPRLVAPAILGLMFCLPGVRTTGSSRGPQWLVASGAGLCCPSSDNLRHMAV